MNAVSTNRLLNFLEQYAINKGLSFFEDPVSDGSALVTFKKPDNGYERSAIIDKKKKSQNLIDINGVFKDLFGDKKTWPEEAKSFFRNGKYEFKAAPSK